MKRKKTIIIIKVMKFKLSFIVILLFLLSVNLSFGTIDRVLFNSGLNAFNRGDYETAIEKLENLVREYPESPNFPKANMYLGHIYYETGEYDKAKKHLLISIRSSTKGSEVWKTSMKLLGVIYYEEGDIDRYEKIFNELQKHNSLSQKIIHQETLTSRSPKQQSPKITPKSTSIREPQTMTNFITNFITNYVFITNNINTQSQEPPLTTNIQSNNIQNITNDTEILKSPEITTNIIKIKEKVDEINKKEEDLEELNRLTDIKNRLLKLNEKALIIQELIQKKMEEMDDTKKNTKQN